jgi:hypothetical protein
MVNKYYSTLKYKIIKILREINMNRLTNGFPSIIDRKVNIRKIIVVYNFILLKMYKIKYNKRLKEFIFQRNVKILMEKNIRKKKRKYSKKKNNIIKIFGKFSIRSNLGNIIKIFKLFNFVKLVKNRYDINNKTIYKNGYTFHLNKETGLYNRITKKEFSINDIENFGDKKVEQNYKRKKKKIIKLNDIDIIINNELNNYPEELRNLLIIVN